jgi:hypothetical protein
MIEVLERCIRLSVPIAKKSAKSLLNPEKIVRCTAGTAFPSIKIVVGNKCFGRELFVWQSGETSGFRTGSRTSARQMSALYSAERNIRGFMVMSRYGADNP